jgi:hypothetical protein
VGALSAANLGLKFLLELAAIAALAYAGAQVGSGVVAVLVAIALPLVFIGLWGYFAAPRSEHRLTTAPRVTFELGMFAAAAVALALAGSAILAVAFAVVALLNAALLFAFDDLEA